MPQMQVHSIGKNLIFTIEIHHNFQYNTEPPGPKKDDIPDSERKLHYTQYSVQKLSF